MQRSPDRRRMNDSEMFIGDADLAISARRCATLQALAGRARCWCTGPPPPRISQRTVVARASLTRSVLKAGAWQRTCDAQLSTQTEWSVNLTVNGLVVGLIWKLLSSQRKFCIRVNNRAAKARYNTGTAAQSSGSPQRRIAVCASWFGGGRRASPRTSRISPKPWPPSLPSPRSNWPSGGLPELRS
jgi:hypothetical protein